MAVTVGRCAMSDTFSTTQLHNRNVSATWSLGLISCLSSCLHMLLHLLNVHLCQYAYLKDLYQLKN